MKGMIKKHKSHTALNPKKPKKKRPSGVQTNTNAKLMTGRNEIDRANMGKGMFGEKIPNKVRVQLSKAGARNLIKGTIEKNRKKAKK